MKSKIVKQMRTIQNFTKRDLKNIILRFKMFLLVWPYLHLKDNLTITLQLYKWAAQHNPKAKYPANINSLQAD
jgi:hypothetical protein